MVIEALVSLARSCSIFATLVLIGLPGCMALRGLRVRIEATIIWCPILGLLCVAVTSWYFFINGLPMVLGFTGLLSLSAATVIYLVGRSRTRNDFSSQIIFLWRTWKFDLLSFLLIVLGYSIFLHFRLPPGSPPWATNGNNDVFDYLKMGTYLANFPAGFPRIAAVDINHALKQDIFGPAALLALAGFVCRTEVVELPIPLLGVAIGLAAMAMARVCRVTYALGAITSLLIAVMFAVSPPYDYIVLHYFSAQLWFVAILITCLALMFEQRHADNRREREVLTVMVCSGTCVMYYYHAWFFQFTLLMPLVYAALFFSKPNSIARRPALAAAGRFVAGIIACNLGAAIVSLGRYGYTIARLNLVRKVGAAGWPLGFIDPAALLGLPVKWDQVATSISAMSVLSSLIVVAAVAVLYRIDKQPGSNIRRIGLLTYLFVFILYLAIWLLYGFSYQQWKFATTLTLPLGFIPIAACIFLLGKRASEAWRPRIGAIVSVCLALFAMLDVYRVDKGWARHLVVFPSALRDAKAVERMPAENAYIDIPDFRQRMAAAVFIGNKPIEFSAPSYYGLGSLQPFRPGSSVAVFRARCNGGRTLARSDSRYETVLAKADELPLLPALEVGMRVQFAGAAETCLRLTGLSAPEESGRRIEGGHASISFRCACDPAAAPIAIVLRAGTVSRERNVSVRLNQGAARDWRIGPTGGREIVLGISKAPAGVVRIELDTEGTPAAGLPGLLLSSFELVRPRL